MFKSIDMEFNVDKYVKRDILMMGEIWNIELYFEFVINIVIFKTEYINIKRFI